MFIIDRNKKIDDISNISKWRVKIGAFIGHIRVTFSKKSWLRKTIDYGLINLSSKLSQWGVKKMLKSRKMII